MRRMTKWIYIFSFILAAAGFLIPFWPLSVLGVLVAVAAGRWLFGVLLALLIDIAWGMPTGLLARLYFPLALLAAVLATVRYALSRRLLDKNPPERL